MALYPQHITELSDRALEIVWCDGHKSLYLAGHLRFHCPCAVCDKIRAKGMSSNAWQELAAHAENVTIKNWRMVGRYAISFSFSDEHSLGMFRYEELRQLCQCDQCQSDAIRIQGPLRLG